MQNGKTAICDMISTNFPKNIAQYFNNIQTGYAGARANMWNDSSESDKYLNSVSSCALEEMHQEERRRDWFFSSGLTLTSFKKAKMSRFDKMCLNLINVNDQ